MKKFLRHWASLVRAALLRVVPWKWTFHLLPDVDLWILKVDPSPSHIQDDVTILYQIANNTSHDCDILIEGYTDEEKPQFVNRPTHIAAATSEMHSANIVWQHGGWHSITLRLRVNLGQQPAFNPQTGPYLVIKYGPPVIDSASTFASDASASIMTPLVDDLSPDEPNGRVDSGKSPAGVVTALAGADGNLLAVAKTSGVWRSQQQGPWRQVSTAPDSGPEHAYSIAIDPLNPTLVAVGERPGDALDPHLDRCGLWESRDGGETWAYTYDPFPDTGTQRINAVAYSRQIHTLFLATAIGVGRRAHSDAVPLPNIEYPASATGYGEITAVVASETMVWARSATTALLFSTDNGKHWEAVPFPPWAAFNQTGDQYSLAAFDGQAFMTFSTPIAGHPETDYTTLLIWDPVDGWSAQRVNDTRDGTGKGGRRQVRSFVVDPHGQIGAGLELFFSNAQVVFQATEQREDWTLHWNVVANTSAGTTAVSAPRFANDLHSDIWDIHLAPDGAKAWIATDGGVFENDWSGNGWHRRNNGLHTQNVHTLTTLLPDSTDSSSRTLLAYATADNDAWWQKPDGQWRHDETLGDCDLSYGDVANRHLVLFTRGLLFGIIDDSCLSDLGDDARHSTFVINPDALDFKIIQTLPSESLDFPRLDAVMLTKMPVKFNDGATYEIAGGWEYFTPDPTVFTDVAFSMRDFNHVPLLLRNNGFADVPDGPRSAFNRWWAEGTWDQRTLSARRTEHVPDFAQRVWVSGGHAYPTYYLFASYQRDGGKGALYRRDFGRDGYVWTRILDGVLAGGHTTGPAFVNPFLPSMLCVIAMDVAHPKGVIMTSSDGGNSFRVEEALTAFVTESGRFPLGPIDPNNGFDAVGSAFHGFPMCNPSDVAFMRSSPSITAVASPFTGVFYGDASATEWWDPGSRVGSIDQAWKRLTPSLPHPFGYVSAIGIAPDAVFVATEGRSILAVLNPGSAAPATYLQQTGNTAGVIAVLRDAVGRPVPWGRVAISATRIDSGQLMSNGVTISLETRVPVLDHVVVRTDISGQVTLPALGTGIYVCELVFLGDGTLGPCRLRFMAS